MITADLHSLSAVAICCHWRPQQQPASVNNLACSTSGDLESSVDDYSTVIELETDHVEATFHRGTVYEKLNKLDEAIADFTKVLSLEPDHVKASYARGTCRNLKGDFAPAIGES